jgi:hypothetical protein
MSSRRHRGGSAPARQPTHNERNRGRRRAKSEAGIREVQVSPDPVDELVVHLDNLRRAGSSTEPDAYLFPNLRGGCMSRQRAAEIVGHADSKMTMDVYAQLQQLRRRDPMGWRGGYWA